LALVLLTAIAPRALTPAGWMPSAQPGAPMVICTGEGAVTLHAPTDHTPAPGAKGHHEPCAFSGVGFASTPDAAPTPAVAVLWTPAPQAEAPATPAVVSRAWRPQLARGPPQLA
jgi:hypothetical protein